MDASFSSKVIQSRGIIQYQVRLLWLSTSVALGEEKGLQRLVETQRLLSGVAHIFQTEKVFLCPCLTLLHFILGHFPPLFTAEMMVSLPAVSLRGERHCKTRLTTLVTVF